MLEAIDSFYGTFTVQDLQERCPSVGLDWIRKILGKEKKAGRLQAVGFGPDAAWIKVGQLNYVPVNHEED